MKEVEKLVYIDTANIYAHPANPRKDVGDVTELAESIRANGVLQNLTVVPYYSQVHKREMDGMYTVIIGHRRLAACKKAGLEKVPCVIAHMTDTEQVRTMMIENMQRSDLTLLEEADGFQMMLDMGETVGSIAEQTGISETTVRRRLSLTKLDRAEMKKAQERGATLQDYAKLDQIKDPSEKNKVLSYIGTAEFNRRLQTALQEQKDREYVEQIVRELDAGGWCKRLSNEEWKNLKSSTVEYKWNYSQWSKRKVEKPEDADRVQYYYHRGKAQVDLYRTKTAEAAPISKAEQARKELRRKLDDIIAELEYQDQDFRDLRDDFIDNFAAFDRHREEIQAFAVKAMLHRLTGSYHYFDMEELAGMLGITCTDDEKLEPKELAEQLWKCPEKVLLFTAYLMLEDGGRSWWQRRWDSTIQASVPCYEPDSQLDLLYECLKSLGYEMSSEEQSASGGGLMQFVEVQKLIEQYQEELKEGAGR